MATLFQAQTMRVTELLNAVSADPCDHVAWNALSVVLRRAGLGQEAEACARRAIDLAGEEAGYWLTLGNALQAQGKLPEAIEAFSWVIARAPQYPGVWNNLGACEHLLGNPERAIAAYERALEVAPSDQALHNLVLALLEARRFVAAETQARMLLTGDEGSEAGWGLLGFALFGQGCSSEAVKALRRSVELSADAVRHSQLLYVSQYVEGVEPGKLLATHREWNALYAAAAEVAESSPASPRKSRERPLRIGLVADSFQLHPFGFLVLPALEAMDAKRCQTVCYSDSAAENSHTAGFRKIAAEWRNTKEMTDAELSDNISRDEIDVLIDLMGHTGKRLLAFARRPAPVQVTWLGYTGTTGLAAMDFLLADRFHVLAGEEAYYVEQILRMPQGYVCYAPPAYAPPVGPLPALSSGCVTFGSFNNPAKFSASIFDAWSEILRRVEHSRLLLKFNGLQEGELQARLLHGFAERGIGKERILLEGWSEHEDLLAAYNRVDLALDTQPYSGGLTTCEALWMGAPVITWPGKTFAGRHATSHLINAGYGQFVASGRAEYIDLAVQWATQLDRLASVRAAMRSQLQRSPLCDATSFAHHLQRLFHEATQRKSSA